MKGKYISPELNLKAFNCAQIGAQLFKRINFIATKMISEPKEINEIYNSIPENKLEEIE